MRSAVWIGMLVGSTIGGLLPELWGGDGLSYAAVLLSGLGGAMGIWIGYKISN